MSELDFLTTLAYHAGGIMEKHFKPGGVAFTTKGDATPVTVADKEIGVMVEKEARRQFPNSVVIREEADFPSRKGNGLEFIIDELDGTDGYSRDMPLAVFAGAFLHDHVVKGSVIKPGLYDGIRIYRATLGGGAYLNGNPIRVAQDSKRLRIAIATSAHKSERYHAWYIAQALAEMGHKVETVTSISYSCAMLAAGHLEGVLFPWNTLHDTAPGDLLVREAGGVTSDLSGDPIDYSQNTVDGFIMANRPETHDLLLSIVRKHRRNPE